MAKALITAETTGLKDLLRDLESLDDKSRTALDAGAKGWGAAAEKAVKQSYLSNVSGATTNDYVYRSIGYFGSDKGVVKRVADGVWMSAGVYKNASTYASYNAEWQQTTGKEGYNAMSAPQIAYWIEGGTSRLYLNGVPVSKTSPRAKAFYLGVSEEDGREIAVAPQPFLLNALATSSNKMDEAFVDAYSEKMKELINNG